MTSATTAGIIRKKLTQALSPTHLEIVDESHLHAAHAGARSGGGHYAVTIVSGAFSGLGLPQRHRLVYRALAAEMNREIHALALNTFAPAEWRPGPTSPGGASAA